jgi:hypothetical protein
MRTVDLFETANDIGQGETDEAAKMMAYEDDGRISVGDMYL